MTDKTLFIALLNEAILDEEIGAVKEAQKRGATLLIITEDATDLALHESAISVTL